MLIPAVTAATKGSVLSKNSHYNLHNLDKIVLYKYKAQVQKVLEGILILNGRRSSFHFLAVTAMPPDTKLLP